MRGINRFLVCVNFALDAVLWIIFLPLAVHDWTVLLAPLFHLTLLVAMTTLYRLGLRWAA